MSATKKIKKKQAKFLSLFSHLFMSFLSCASSFWRYKLSAIGGILALRIFSLIVKRHGAHGMYCRKICIQYQRGDELLPCPIKWLDNFSMRSFTNDSIFDDTLPVHDGLMEIGTRVPIDRLKEAMEDWFRKKSYLPKESSLALQEGLSNHPIS